MKIGLVVPGGVDRSGTRRVIPALLALIAELSREHQVEVVALDQEPTPGQWSLRGATIHNLALPARFASMAWWQRPRLLWALDSVVQPLRGVEVVHGLWLHPPGWLAVLAARRLRVPSVVSVGGGELEALPAIDYGGARSWPARLRTRAALTLADAVTGGSHRALQPVAPIRNDAFWIPLGVDRNVFSAAVDRQSGPPWRLAWIATHNRVKRPELALDVILELRANGHDVHLEMVGEDLLNGMIERRVAELELGDHVTIHGFLPTSAVADLLATTHVHLVTSQWESQSVVTLEAAAAGVPTVGTPVGILRDMGQATARVVAPDAPTMATAVAQLLESPQHRLAVARTARGWARTHSSGWTATRLVDLYGALVQRKTGLDTYL